MFFSKDELQSNTSEKKIDVTTDCGVQKGLELKYKQTIGYVLLLKKVLVQQIADTAEKQIFI